MKRVALLGMPNAGKSTLFNRLTGSRARAGNWPGMTVELLSAKLLTGEHVAQLVDLPGIYDLAGHSADERVVMDFLAAQRIDLVLVVANAVHVERQAALLAELSRLRVPVALALNMADEAAQLGVCIDVAGLARALGIPVCLVSAKTGLGMEAFHGMLRAALHAGRPADALDPGQIEDAARTCVSVPAQASHALTARLDSVLLHPWLGLPLFLAALFLLFEAVFALGAPLQDGLTVLFTGFRSAALEPLLSGWPPAARGLALDGLYNGLATVATFMPLIVIFFLAMALVEDTGYLSRAAFLMDGLMSRLGLDGRSFVMVLMGFGCNVPAVMATRVMRSRGLRLLTMLLIPLSLCSGRLQVFLFFIAALFPARTAPLVLLSLYVAGVAAALLTAALFKGRFGNDEPFVLEMPPYRLPTLRHMLLRAWHEVEHFLRRATRFIVAGVVLVWLLTHFPEGTVPGGPDTWAGRLGEGLQPLLAPLGIEPALGIALLFGVVAKEIVIGSLAVIYGSEGSALAGALSARIGPAEAFSFMLFVLVYTPCLSTIATLRAEARSASFTAVAIAWPLCLAWTASFAFYQMTRLLS